MKVYVRIINQSIILKKETISKLYITFIFFNSFIAPLEKLISSDRLSFIPNLYYQQYRLLDVLTESRSDFPEQKILVERQKTTHDFLLQQVKKNYFQLQQEIKYRKAICFNLVKAVKQQFFKKKLKKQQKYLFHRVAYSQLAEAVRNKIDENRNEIKNKQKKDDVQIKKKLIKPKINDDIFLQKSESQQNIGIGDSDLIGDIFDNLKMEQMEHKEKSIKFITIQQYIIKLNSYDSKEKECKKTINRKNCLKKINENIRKRIKSKLNQDVGEKNLNSATVLITSLISNQVEIKQNQNQPLYIDTPFQNEFLSNIESKSKRKKQDSFQLKWDKDLIGDFGEKNGKFEINKCKFDTNYLTTTMSKDDNQYEKIFMKNIMSKQPFPPSITSIPSLDSKFKITPFYNTVCDNSYQKFIMKHNKKIIFEKFKNNSNFTLVDTYNNDTQWSNISKIFLNPKGTITDKVIYKKNNNKLIPVSTLHQKINLSKEELLILSFLVREYLGIFGSNWKIITMLILSDSNFSNKHLTTQQIQQLYQIAKDKDSYASLQQINMMNKKILPSSIFVNGSYEIMQPELKMSPIYQQLTEQTQESSDKYTKQIDLQNYENLLNECLDQHEIPSEYTYKNTSKAYENYVNKIKLPRLQENTQELTQNLSSIINQFEGRTQIKYVDHKQPSKINQCSDWVMDKIKNQIKFNTPIRKKKYVTDKLSQLVKILHTLKQKLQQQAQGARQPPIPIGRAPLTANNVNELPKPPTASVQQGTISATPTPTPQKVQPIQPTHRKTLQKNNIKSQGKAKGEGQEKTKTNEEKKEKTEQKKSTTQKKKKGGKDGEKDNGPNQMP